MSVMELHGDPILLAECFVKDFQMGYWDEFDDDHLMAVCRAILTKLDTLDGSDAERFEKAQMAKQQIQCVQSACNEFAQLWAEVNGIPN